MKTRIFTYMLTLALLLSVFTGCKNEAVSETSVQPGQTSTPSAPGESSPENPDAPGTEEEEIVLDYTGFEMPEAMCSLRKGGTATMRI